MTSPSPRTLGPREWIGTTPEHLCSIPPAYAILKAMRAHSSAVAVELLEGLLAFHGPEAMRAALVELMSTFAVNALMEALLHFMDDRLVTLVAELDCPENKYLWRACYHGYSVAAICEALLATRDRNVASPRLVATAAAAGRAYGGEPCRDGHSRDVLQASLLRFEGRFGTGIDLDGLDQEINTLLAEGRCIEPTIALVLATLARWGFVEALPLPNLKADLPLTTRVLLLNLGLFGDELDTQRTFLQLATRAGRDDPEAEAALFGLLSQCRGAGDPVRSAHPPPELLPAMARSALMRPGASALAAFLECAPITGVTERMLLKGPSVLTLAIASEVAAPAAALCLKRLRLEDRTDLEALMYADMVDMTRVAFVHQMPLVIQFLFTCGGALREEATQALCRLITRLPAPELAEYLSRMVSWTSHSLFSTLPGSDLEFYCYAARLIELSAAPRDVCAHLARQAELMDTRAQNILWGVHEEEDKRKRATAAASPSSPSSGGEGLDSDTIGGNSPEEVLMQDDELYA